MKRITLRVSGMKCEGCAASVASALERVAGVRRVEVSLEGGEAHVQTESDAPPADLVGAVEAAGYRATPTG